MNVLSAIWTTLGMIPDDVKDEIERRVADYVLDQIEDYVEDSEREWDDRIVLPIIQRLREAMDWPDDDDTQSGGS